MIGRKLKINEINYKYLNFNEHEFIINKNHLMASDTIHNYICKKCGYDFVYLFDIENKDNVAFTMNSEETYYWTTLDFEKNV